MPRLQGSVFAVGLLMSVSSLLHAQEARITVPLGWYSLPEFAQALSTPERTVTCRSDLSQRVALVHLKERSWEEVRALVQEIGLRLEPSEKGRWRLEWLPSVEMRERRWRTQIAQAQDRQLLERMRLIREKVPVLPEKHWDEYYHLSQKLDEHVRALAQQDTETEFIFDAYTKQLESLDLGQWAIPPEVMRWARQMAQLPEELAPPLYGDKPKDSIEYRARQLLTASDTAVEYHLLYALARLWGEASYRLSFLEAYEQGFSVRVVPLLEVVAKVPEVRFLARAIPQVAGKRLAPRNEEVPLEDLYCVYFLHYPSRISEPFAILCLVASVSDSALIEELLPVAVRNREKRAEQSNLWEQARKFYQPVWQEARSYVEQAQRATETALQHPALKQPFEAEGLTSASWSRWVYQWAKQTGNEVLMLLNPAQDPHLKATPKPTLAELYRLSITPRERFMSAWLTLQMREGVLIADVLNSCIVLLRDYPLASLKRLYERWDALDYRDYVEYYRSVSPQQNRWWFMDLWQWNMPPFGKALQEKFQPRLERYTFGPLWYGIYLMEHLSEAQRKELLEKGELQVDLMGLPEAVRRELAELIRVGFCAYSTGLSAGKWHPRWLLVSREYPREESEEGHLFLGNRPLVTLRAERVSVGEDKARLRFRFAPNPSSAIDVYFAFDTFETPYNRWLFEIRRSAN